MKKMFKKIFSNKMIKRMMKIMILKIYYLCRIYSMEYLKMIKKNLIFCLLEILKVK